MKEIPKNCRECGEKLKIGTVDADKIKVWSHSSPPPNVCNLYPTGYKAKYDCRAGYETKNPQSPKR